MSEQGLMIGDVRPLSWWSMWLWCKDGRQTSMTTASWRRSGPWAALENSTPSISWVFAPWWAWPNRWTSGLQYRQTSSSIAYKTDKRPAVARKPRDATACFPTPNDSLILFASAYTKGQGRYSTGSQLNSHLSSKSSSGGFNVEGSLGHLRRGPLV